MPGHRQRSTRRKTQAEGTRREILAAARRLFAERGYTATSMAAIAAEANVVVQTIYTSIGPKRTLLLALNDVIDEEGGVAETMRLIETDSLPQNLVRLYVGATRQISERCGDIVWMLIATQSIEPDVAAVVREGQRRHDLSARRVVQRLHGLQALRPEYAVDRASDILASMTWHETYRRLTGHYGWSFDECETWLTTSLSTLLLRPTT